MLVGAVRENPGKPLEDALAAQVTAPIKDGDDTRSESEKARDAFADRNRAMWKGQAAAAS